MMGFIHGWGVGGNIMVHKIQFNSKAHERIWDIMENINNLRINYSTPHRGELYLSIDTNLKREVGHTVPRNLLITCIVTKSHKKLGIYDISDIVAVLHRNDTVSLLNDYIKEAKNSRNIHLRNSKPSDMARSLIKYRREKYTRIYTQLLEANL